MQTPSIPAGIDTHTLKDGSIRYEVRVHRRGMPEQTKRFDTVKEALKWRTSIEALLDNGIDPSSFKQGRKISANSARAAPETTKAVNRGAQLTVAQAVTNYLKYREGPHEALPDNRKTDYERVRDDIGGLFVEDLTNLDIVNYIKKLLVEPIKRDAQKISDGTLKGKPRTYAKATVRKFVYAMKKTFDWHAKNGFVKLNEFLFDFDDNALPGPWEGKRERRLLQGEEERLYCAGLTRGDITYTPDDWRAC